MKYAIISTLVMFGLSLAVYSLWFHSDFEKLCHDIAAERGEVDLLKSGIGGPDLGLSAYRQWVLTSLLNDSFDTEFNLELLKRGKDIALRYRRMRLLSRCYMAVIIGCGLFYEW